MLIIICDVKDGSELLTLTQKSTSQPKYVSIIHAINNSKWQWPTIGDRRKIKRKLQAYRFRNAVWKPKKWVSLNNEAWGEELLKNLKVYKIYIYEITNYHDSSCIGPKQGSFDSLCDFLSNKGKVSWYRESDLHKKLKK